MTLIRNFLFDTVETSGGESEFVFRGDNQIAGLGWNSHEKDLAEYRSNLNT